MREVHSIWSIDQLWRCNRTGSEDRCGKGFPDLNKNEQRRLLQADSDNRGLLADIQRKKQLRRQTNSLSFSSVKIEFERIKAALPRVTL